MNLRLSFILAGSLLLEGCGTLTALSGGLEESQFNEGYVYGGVDIDRILTRNSSLVLIDLPLSFAADTVLLPITIPLEVLHRKQQRRRQRESLEQKQQYEEAAIRYLDNCARLMTSGPINPVDAHLLYYRYDDFSDPAKWPPRMREESLRWLRLSAEGGDKYSQQTMFDLADREGNKAEAYAWATTYLARDEFNIWEDMQASIRRMQSWLEAQGASMSAEELMAADKLARHYVQFYIAKGPLPPARIHIGYSRAIICDGIPAPQPDAPGSTSAATIRTRETAGSSRP